MDKNKSRTPIQIDCEANELLSACSNIILALRHPNNKGISTDLARSFVAKSIGKLKTIGYINDLDISVMMNINNEAKKIQQNKDGSIDLFKSTEKIN